MATHKLKPQRPAQEETQVRCERCDKLLFKSITGRGLIEISCPRCKHKKLIELEQ